MLFIIYGYVVRYCNFVFVSFIRFSTFALFIFSLVDHTRIDEFYSNCEERYTFGGLLEQESVFFFSIFLKNTKKEKKKKMNGK